MAIDRALHVHRPGVDGGQRVGHRAPGVVVAVDAEWGSDLCCRGHHLPHLRGQHAAVGVTQDDHLRSRVGRHLDHLQRIGRVGAVAVEEVLGVDEDPAALGGEEGDRIGDHGQVLSQVGAQRPENVLVVALGDQAHHLGARVQEGSGQRVALRPAADPARRAERGQRRVAQRQVTRRGGREEGGVGRVGAWPAPLDETDPPFIEDPRDPELVAHRQAQPLLLRPVAQRGVVEVERGRHGGKHHHRLLRRGVRPAHGWPIAKVWPRLGPRTQISHCGAPRRGGSTGIVDPVGGRVLETWHG